MIQHIQKFIQRKSKVFSVKVSILISFVLLHLWNTPLIAFAADKDGTNDNFNLKAPSNSDAFSAVTDYLDKLIPAAQGLAAVVMILSCIAIGTRLGYASGVGDSRTRQEAIMELFWLIVAGVIVVNARSIIGIAGAVK